jgi:hypothetical protein
MNKFVLFSDWLPFSRLLVDDAQALCCNQVGEERREQINYWLTDSFFLSGRLMIGYLFLVRHFFLFFASPEYRVSSVYLVD